MAAVERGISLVSSGRTAPYVASIVTLVSCLVGLVPQSAAQLVKRAFTVRDDIGMTNFYPPYYGPKQLQFSPDGKYFAVYCNKGRLDLNRPEDTLRFYRSNDVEHFLSLSDSLNPIR